ncbi:unnamed protein product [Callosobruchus maculatus]|uniref:Uncharacterized protein n=1 Tax=Callosobruchus maculatus TaxID=64391 RepID=A0A653DJC2_CALMS|nr:unnamed protein product [Callosobruchus maculatus]
MCLAGSNMVIKVQFRFEFSAANNRNNNGSCAVTVYHKDSEYSMEKMLLHEHEVPGWFEEYSMGVLNIM